MGCRLTSYWTPSLAARDRSSNPDAHPPMLALVESVTVLISFVEDLLAKLCNTHIMSAQGTIRNTILAIGIVVAAALGVFLFQGEVLIAIFLGAPSIIIIGGLLWLTHNLFAEAKP
jgi:hypothetical protein